MGLLLKRTAAGIGWSSQLIIFRRRAWQPGSQGPDDRSVQADETFTNRSSQWTQVAAALTEHLRHISSPGFDSQGLETPRNHVLDFPANATQPPSRQGPLSAGVEQRGRPRSAHCWPASRGRHPARWLVGSSAVQVSLGLRPATRAGRSATRADEWTSHPVLGSLAEGGSARSSRASTVSPSSSLSRWRDRRRRSPTSLGSSPRRTRASRPVGPPRPRGVLRGLPAGVPPQPGPPSRRGGDPKFVQFEMDRLGSSPPTRGCSDALIEPGAALVVLPADAGCSVPVGHARTGCALPAVAGVFRTWPPPRTSRARPPRRRGGAPDWPRL